MLVPDPKFLQPGDNAWQLTAATLVGLMSVPGLAVLYGGLIKRKFAVNSAIMVIYAFSIVMIVWVLWGFKMGFGAPLKLGPGILSGMVGIPGPILNSLSELGQAQVPLLTAAMPAMHFPSASLAYFQFVFAAISPAILAGAVLGRMNFKAWMIFVPLWSTFVYSINAFMLWGGGWLGQLGAVDYSGGYVIHVAAGVSGFVAAAVIGPRLRKDRNNANPNDLLLSVVGAGILWLGWNGFNGGDPYFANADAAAAVINTNIAAATALVSWMFLDVFTSGKAQLGGIINGMVCGLVAITPAAGYVNGEGALIIGILGSVIPWFTMTKLGNRGIFAKVDDTLGVVHTHAFAGAIGGIMVGVLADPNMPEYLGTKGTSNVAVTGWVYGNFHQVVLQVLALAVIVVYDGAMTFILLKLVSLVVPLRMPEPALESGDKEMHGEEARDMRLTPHQERILAQFAAEEKDA